VLPLVEVLRKSEAWLRSKGVPSPRLDAELLLGHALGMDRVGLYLAHDRPLDEAELGTIRELVRRRGGREPLAWITGKRSFWSLELHLVPGVLVPRPETETLVEAALGVLPAGEERFVADLGCGSGAVGLAIAEARPDVKVYATDLSEAALGCTRDNARRLGLQERVAVLRGSWLDAIPAHRRVDLVVSNPPYLRTGDLAALEPEVRDHEPRLALDGGVDGLDAYRALLPAAAKRARDAVLVEVGAGQAEGVGSLMEQAGLEAVETRADLAGRPRVVVARRSNGGM
jgi:release factor glutamine methyltransferase